MASIFHSLFIWPVQAFISFLFLGLQELTDHHPGVTIVLLSLAVNLIILPLYLVADRWQKEERDLRLAMAPKLAALRAVFKGDERHMIERTYYRQSGYHPLQSLKSSIGLLMQIPFFLAAYLVLSHATELQTHARPLADLSQPDGLLRFNGWTINVLPLVMTALNLASAFVYGRHLKLRDNVQLFVMAGLFLVLLYNCPSGVVLYWTVNNLFSLGKNVVCQRKRPGRILHGLVLAGVGAWAAWYVLVVGEVSFSWGVAVTLVLAAIAAAPWVWKSLSSALESSDTGRLPGERRWFFASCAVLAVMAGAAIPALFLSASPFDLPAGDPGTVRVALQAFSLFVLLPAGLWALATAPVRRLLTWLMGFLAVSALISAFVSPPTTSFNPSFSLNDPAGLSVVNDWITWAVFGAAGALVAAVVVFRRETWALAASGLAAASLMLVAVVSWASLPPSQTQSVAPQSQELQPVFSFSRQADNQVLLFIDGFPAPLFPEMLDSVAGLKASLTGFTWYANTVSYTNHTLHTTPAMMGGPDYTPEAINARQGVPLAEKHAEGLRAMPGIFGAAGERVTLSDPWYISFEGGTDNKPFEGLPNTKAVNLEGLYTERYFEEQGLSREPVAELGFQNDILTRFSLLRMLPPGSREALYDGGRWWIVPTGLAVDRYTAGGFPNLVYLPELSQVDDGPGGANFFFSEVFHDGRNFDAQGRLSSQAISAGDLARFGDVTSAQNVYAGRAVLTQVARWLDWLKTQGVYDRTRIMIVADHGHRLNDSQFGPQTWWRPLILFKDYGAQGPLQTDETLKTNADVPSFLTAGFPGAIPPRPLGDAILIHEGPHTSAGQGADRYLFDQTWTLKAPDSRVLGNWVEVKP